ncbi:MAG: hypothetical protein WAN17_01905 [Candidatus Sulfotelmatobacter sp.]
MENPRHAQLRKELPAEAPGAAELQGILRLRGWSASRTTRSAQDDRALLSPEIADVTNVHIVVTLGAWLHSVNGTLRFPSKVIPFLSYTL